MIGTPHQHLLLAAEPEAPHDRWARAGHGLHRTTHVLTRMKDGVNQTLFLVRHAFDFDEI